ncbi:S1C family serine protease [Gleimia hominis]|uniref:S1C family serine protease n=1 Tax=Gleimia hominis TaxID=595468 RepID=UPI001E5DDC0C|nr:trypsin-like peptidase domain-containing protein [Gleimia hominis]WIK64533.1 trypsin-like peptidase domain-containing protein [Gleimia hominis]
MNNDETWDPNSPTFTGDSQTGIPHVNREENDPQANAEQGFQAPSQAPHEQTDTREMPRDSYSEAEAQTWPPVVPQEKPRNANKRGGKSKIVVGTAVLALLVGGVSGAGAGYYMAKNASQPVSSQTQTHEPQGKSADIVQAKGESQDWQAVAKAVRPATVSIQVSNGNSADTGSGVIWDGEGHVVTNYHVVSNATNGGQIIVSLTDGRLYKAEIVGTDPETDLAVIKLANPPKDLTAANMGDSEKLSVGQAVMAIGSPLGYNDTVTTGIVSALDRPVAVKTAVPDDEMGSLPNPFGMQRESRQADTVVTNAIQIDASINPGNSGGPLFDETGRVIGINSSIASTGSSESAGSIGVGFAIPSNLVSNVVKQLIENGKAQHAFLGVSISSAPVQVDGVNRVGAQVQSVVRGGPGEEAGLKQGDVILSIDGKAVTNAQSLTGFVRRYNAGEQVTIEFARSGKIQKVQATLQARSETRS